MIALRSPCRACLQVPLGSPLTILFLFLIQLHLQLIIIITIAYIFNTFTLGLSPNRVDTIFFNARGLLRIKISSD